MSEKKDTEQGELFHTDLNNLGSLIETSAQLSHRENWLTIPHMALIPSSSLYFLLVTQIRKLNNT